ncbi:MAG: RecX family transcriptional regulator [candidate division Zixibacteria bacterium]|nr:RecX family transcriptional regulator [candidate division Zixibacteria bacterium]
MPLVIKSTKTRRSLILDLEGGSIFEFPLTVTRLRSFYEGDEIDLAELESLKSKALEIQADDLLARKIGLKPRTLGESRKILKEYGYSEEVTVRIVERFVERRILDDYRLGSDLVKSILKERPAGRMYLLSALLRRMISREMAEEILEEIMSDVDETEMAIRLLKKRWSSLKTFDLETARHKGYNHLARRSLSYEASKAAFERLAAEEPNFHSG